MRITFDMGTERIFSLRAVKNAHNLSHVGWDGGYLMVIFKGKTDRYIYGPNVEAGEADKIIANPYPDSLFAKLKKKHNWQCHKLSR